MSDIPPTAKTLDQLETLLQSAIRERATASEVRELRQEIAEVKALLAAKRDALADSDSDDDDDDGFSLFGD